MTVASATASAYGRSVPFGWNGYLAWNSAICASTFTTEMAGLPVYLDMDDDILADIGETIGISRHEAARNLTGTVRGTLDLRPDGAVFGRHLHLIRQWRLKNLQRPPGAEPPPPPVVGLLAVLTMAAEAMSADEGHHANGYYPRLHELLGTSASVKRHLEAAYRRHAETLWGALNTWLVDLDGQRGLPTATALIESNRYVALPMSQALVRAGDRRRFHRMFRQLGLAPGADLSPEAMESLLAQWMNQTPCPASRSIQALWSHGTARERLAALVATELSLWDGTGVAPTETEYENSSRQVLLVLQPHRFPRPELELSFVAEVDPKNPPDQLELETTEGAATLEVHTIIGNRVGPRSLADLDLGSVVGGLLKLRDRASDMRATRRPRRLVPCRRDDSLRVFVECERLQLGEDSLLLVKNEPQLLGSLLTALDQVARPGFEVVESMPGLPTGWVLVTGVQIMTTLPAGPRRLELEALVPPVTSQLVLAGGLRIPGRVRRWSRLRPPEIRAVMHGADELRLRLTALHNESASAVSYQWTSTTGALLVDLAREDLGDGDFEVCLEADNRVVQRAQLRLRSSDHLGASSEPPPMLGHIVGKHLDVVTARKLDHESSASSVVGACAPLNAAPLIDDVPLSTKVWWTQPVPPRPSRLAPRMSVAEVDPSSCLVSGAHRIELPTFHGRARRGLISGECAQCGIVKRFPAHPYQARKGTPREDHPTSGSPLHALNPRELPPTVENTASAEDVLDVLRCLQGGSASHLVAAAGELAAAPFVLDSLVRSLEALGTLEVERDGGLRPTAWVVAPRMLAGTADGRFLLTGAWSGAERARLQRDVEQVGGAIVGCTGGHGLTIWAITGLSVGTAQAVAGDAQIVPEAGERLLNVLPPLGAVLDMLPRVPLTVATQIMRFSPQSAAWLQEDLVMEPGAYRLRTKRGQTYLFVTDEDLATGVGAVGSAALVKHLEGRRCGTPLVAYDETTQRLAVPLGAELPGLYQRSAVLSAGRLPARAEEQKALLYDGVPARVARGLASLLTL